MTTEEVVCIISFSDEGLLVLTDEDVRDIEPFFLCEDHTATHAHPFLNPQDQLNNAYSSPSDRYSVISFNDVAKVQLRGKSMHGRNLYALRKVWRLCR